MNNKAIQGRFCPHCGTEHPRVARFCGQCGAKVGSEILEHEEAGERAEAEPARADSSPGTARSPLGPALDTAEPGRPVNGSNRDRETRPWTDNRPRPDAGTRPRLPLPVRGELLSGQVTGVATWLALGAGLVAMLANFLPWITVSGSDSGTNTGTGPISAAQSFNGTYMGNDGWVVLALGGIAALIQLAALARGRDERTWQGLGELVLGAVIVFIAIRDLSTVSSALGSLSTTVSLSLLSLVGVHLDVSAGLGLWLAAAAGAVLGLGGLLRLAASR